MFVVYVGVNLFNQGCNCPDFSNSSVDFIDVDILNISS